MSGDPIPLETDISLVLTSVVIRFSGTIVSTVFLSLVCTSELLFCRRPQNDAVIPSDYA